MVKFTNDMPFYSKCSNLAQWFLWCVDGNGVLVSCHALEVNLMF